MTKSVRTVPLLEYEKATAETYGDSVIVDTHDVSDGAPDGYIADAESTSSLSSVVAPRNPLPASPLE